MSSARKASEAPFPYGWPGRISYFIVGLDSVYQLTTRDEMRETVMEALAGDVEIFAAWPGQYRTDVFWIDRPELLAEAIQVAAA